MVDGSFGSEYDFSVNSDTLESVPPLTHGRISMLCFGLVLMLASGCRTYTLPEVQSPHHLNLSHLECHSVRATSDLGDVQSLLGFLAKRTDGWRYWRTTYFGLFQNAFPYADIQAYDARSNLLYSVGIDRNQITFHQGDVKLRKKTNRSEHDELLESLGASDRLFEEIDAKRLETLRLMYPVVESLDKFKHDVGRYPSNTEGIGALVHNPGAPGWNGPYVATFPVDAWGTPFRFYTKRFDIRGKVSVFEDVWSAGHDRTFDFPEPIGWRGNDFYWDLESLHGRMHR